MVKDEQVAALRAFLVGEFDEGERLTGELVASGQVDGYGELVHAAFAVAVNRRFRPSWTVADVVTFVASTRVRSASAGTQVDPRAAEAFIRRALGDSVAGEFGDVTKARAQVFVLIALVVDERFDGEGMDAFLARARSLADRSIGPVGRS